MKVIPERPLKCQMVTSSPIRCRARRHFFADFVNLPPSKPQESECFFPHPLCTPAIEQYLLRNNLGWGVANVHKAWERGFGVHLKGPHHEPPFPTTGERGSERALEMVAPLTHTRKRLLMNVHGVSSTGAFEILIIVSRSLTHRTRRVCEVSSQCLLKCTTDQIDR